MRALTSCLAVCTVFVTTAVGQFHRSGGFYKDVPFAQDFAEKIQLSEDLAGTRLSAVRCDRNGRILVLSDKGLLQVHDGQLVPDRQYRPLRDMQIRAFDIYEGQFVYLTDEAVFSNAWAGRFHLPHGLPDARSFKIGDRFSLLVAGKDAVLYFREGARSGDKLKTPPGTEHIEYDSRRNRFYLFGSNRVECFTPGQDVRNIYEGQRLKAAELATGGNIFLSTDDGVLILEWGDFEQTSVPEKTLPWPDIRCMKDMIEKVWFGSPRGAFALDGDLEVDYYASKRWLVDDNVIDIADGPNDSMLILTEHGLSIIHFEKMTLEQKAEHFDRLTRERHIRYGFNSALRLSSPGDLSTGTLIDTDNDGLWTSMYLAGELFRYAVTKSDEALRNCYEMYEAMERLTHINPLEGFPARTFERNGYQVADKSRWHTAPDPRWAWKATTSSDEIVGHFFAYSIFAELIPSMEMRKRAVTLMAGIMDHIVRNDWYLIDVDGKPTQWGRWNPEYVNQFPGQVGDRKLNSAEIIAFLQATYHFTGKEIYKEKAFELLFEQGYLDNIMTPVSQYARVPGIDLTTEWNHSDDELAFLSYWPLYKYAFNEELREKYGQAIKDHWQIERPEKNPLWNLIYAMTGATDFDLRESIWTLEQFPLDTISWTVTNNHRKDLEFLEPNFRHQSTRTVLPPDERPMSKHNGNAFRLDGGSGGYREYSGDIYLLPYWMGRYLKKIQ